MTHMIGVIIGTGNGLARVWRQAFVWTKDDFMAVGNFTRNLNSFIQEDAFGNVCKISAMWSRPLCVQVTISVFYIPSTQAHTQRNHNTTTLFCTNDVKISLIIVARDQPLNNRVHSRPLTMISHEFYPDSKVHGANMGPIWGRQDPDGHHVGPMNFAIWVWTSMAWCVSDTTTSASIMRTWACL